MPELDQDTLREFEAAMRTALLVARERGRQFVREKFPINARSKYSPHEGAKQRARRERRESIPRSP